MNFQIRRRTGRRVVKVHRVDAADLDAGQRERRPVAARRARRLAAAGSDVIAGGPEVTSADRRWPPA